MKFSKALFINFHPTQELRASAEELIEHLGEMAPKTLSIISVVERIGCAFLCRMEITSRLGALHVVCGSAEAKNAIEEARRRLVELMVSQRWAPQLN